MFETAISLCRRLLGRDGAAQEERRAWQRYPADFSISVHDVDAGHETIRAQVRDLSQGGANLVVDRRYEEGQMLSCQLPSQGGESQQVLACVVRVRPSGPGKWSIGCNFSRELDDEDLECFGAKRIRHDPQDQRTWQRFTTLVQARCQPVGDGESDDMPFTATVINLSASGVGLAVSKSVDVGTLLSVELMGRDGLAMRTMLACVVHVTTHGPGEWGLGCNFIHSLSEADLLALV